MARNHARLLTAIWSDPHFTALEPEAQRVYFLLLSQPDLSACGVLAFLPRRWARLSALTSVEEIENAISLLEEARFVMVDNETDELLIRTFVIHDGGLNNPKMRGATKSAMRAVHSRVLRSAISAVLPEQFRAEIVDGLPMAKAIPLESDSRTERKAIAMGTVNGSNAEVGGRRQSPGPSGSDVPEVPPKGGQRGSRIPDDFALTDEHRAWASKNCPDIDVELHTKRFKNHWQAKSGKDATKLDWHKTWENWLLKEQSDFASKHQKPTPGGAVTTTKVLERCPTCSRLLVDCAGHGPVREVTPLFKPSKASARG